MTTDLSGHLSDYLALRRALGFKLDDAARQLPSLVEYMNERGEQILTVDVQLSWACQPQAAPGTTVWPRRVTAGRGFAKYMVGVDPRTEIPPMGVVRYVQRRKPPYLYSDTDIAGILASVPKVIGSPVKVATYQTLVGLLACTGMRVGEAIHLDDADIDWDQGVLTLRLSKFGKTRLVPVDPSCRDALAAYQRVRRDRVTPSSPAFLQSNAGTRLIYSPVQVTFQQFIAAAGIGGGHPRRPRLHDLRHTFAVNTLVSWYQQGLDVANMLPRLSTYLGHREPRSTYWYLSASPQLLAMAADRLEHSNRRPW